MHLHKQFLPNKLKFSAAKGTNPPLREAKLFVDLSTSPDFLSSLLFSIALYIEVNNSNIRKKC